MSFNRLLLVIKQTAFDAYTAQEQLARAAGRALSYDNARMGRLKARHDTHMFQVERITRMLAERGAHTTSVMRDDVTPAHVAEADLVLALGGDGTTLIASHIMRGDTPLLGVNTDRATMSDLATLYRSSEPLDMRRSTGHLCACAAPDVATVLDDVLEGRAEPTTLARMRTSVAGVELAPALNDVLIAHPSPGAVSRYSVHVGGGSLEDEDRSAQSRTNGNRPPLWFHVRSSGLRACTASGSTAAMRSAGGKPMHYASRRMQFMDREPIYHDHMPPPSSGHGFYEAEETMTLRWNSRVGRIFLDGAHVTHEVKMGDRITLSAAGPTLRLYTSPWFRRNHAEMWPDRKEAMRMQAEDGETDWIIE